MKLRMIGIILTLGIVVSTIPVYSDELNGLLLSENFSSYAENETDFESVKGVTGIDTRVVDDNGNKVLYSRAFGENISVTASPKSSDAPQFIVSAKIKLDGALTSGKLLSCTMNAKKITFLKLLSDGSIALPDGRIIGGAPQEDYKTYTFLFDKEKQIYSLYVDKKCIVGSWFFQDGTIISSPSKLEFGIMNNDVAESDLYLDDLRVYEGNTLPWMLSFPEEEHNSDVKEFTETAQIDTSCRILNDVEFGNLGGVTLSLQGGNISNAKYDDGCSTLNFSADDKTKSSSFIDINNSDLAKCTRYIFDIRFRINKLSGNSSLGIFDTKNSYGSWRLGYDAYPNGTISSNDAGISVATFKTGEWVRLSFAYDISQGKVDVYKDGVQSASHAISEDYYPVIFRIDFINALGGTNNTDIDWIRAYTGKKLQDDEFFTADDTATESTEDSVSVMDPPDKLKSALKDVTAFMLTNDTVYIDGKKVSYKDKKEKPYEENGVLMIPQHIATQMCSKEISFDKSTGQIKIGSDVTMSLAQTDFLKGATKLELSVAPKEKDGVVYFPLRGIAQQVMGKNVIWDDRGCIIVTARNDITVDKYHYLDRFMSWKAEDLIYRYLQFDNPTGGEMIQEIKKRYPNKQHPRVLYTYDDVEYMLNKIDEDAQWQQAYQTLKEDAAQWMKTDFSAGYTASDSTKQAAAVDFQNAIISLSVTYLLSGDTSYADKGIEIMKGFCTWDTMGYETANLTSGHWSLAIGVGYDSFYNYMTSNEQGKNDLAFIRQSVSRLSFKDHELAYQGLGGPHWITMQDNFLGVIGGGLMTLLLSVADEDDLKSQNEFLLENVMKSLEIAVSLFYPNGGYYESPGYTTYMMTNTAIAINAMFNCCGTDYGLGGAKGFNKIGYYLSYMQTPNAHMNFHDSGSGYIGGKFAYFLAKRYNDATQALMAKKQEILANKKSSLSSLFEFSQATEGKSIIDDLPNMPLDYYFNGVECGSFSNSRDLSNPTFVGFHGGWTNIPHDSLDLGEFVFESDGVLWAMDLGGDSYSLPGYFETAGYKIYRKRPEGENCLVLNPKKEVDTYYGQKLGACAELISLDVNKPNGAMAVYDLTDAYERDAQKYIRGYYFGDNRNTLTVQDELTVKNNTEVYWFMHTATNIEILSNSRARLTSDDGHTLTADVYCDVADYTLEVLDSKPLPTSPAVVGQATNAGTRKLAIHVPDASGNVTISVKLSPDNGRYEKTDFNVLPISKWEIEQGSGQPIPMITGMYADGELLEGFLPGKEEYNIVLPYGTQKVPQITAEIQNGELSIKQADDFSNKAVVEISRNGIGYYKVTISFEVERLPIVVSDSLSNAKPSIGAKGTQIVPKAVSTSKIPEKDNPPEKTIDGDFVTRGTNEGLGQWFEFDLGEVMDISGVSIAFYDGNIRSFIFDILYSDDGINYKRVFSGSSTGKSLNEYESIEIEGRARYIRYVGGGNTGSKWNSITEFRAFR